MEAAHSPDPEVIVFTSEDRMLVDTCSLVLSARNIAHRIEREGRRFGLDPGQGCDGTGSGGTAARLFPRKQKLAAPDHQQPDSAVIYRSAGDFSHGCVGPVLLCDRSLRPHVDLVLSRRRQQYSGAQRRSIFSSCHRPLPALRFLPPGRQRTHWRFSSSFLPANQRYRHRPAVGSGRRCGR